MQILVLGMHRSGTSVLARLLNLMGAYFGPEGISIGANAENPKGFWERRDVRQLNDSVLHRAGCDWNRVSGFDPSRLPAMATKEFEAGASRLLLDMDAHRPWFIKEPRLCLLLPLWRKLLEAPVAVHIVRDPREVAASLERRNAMPVDVGLALWERYVRDAIDASEGMPSLIVAHHHLMADPGAQTSRILQWLQARGVQGLRMPGAAEIDAFVSPALHHEHGGQDGGGYEATPQLQLFRSLVDAPDAPPPRGQGVPAQVVQVLMAYEATLPPLEPRKVLDTESALHERIGAREQEAKLLRERNAALERELTRRDERLAKELSVLDQLQAHARERDAALAAARESAGALRVESARARQDSESLRAERKQLTEEVTKLKADIDARFLEIAKLTELLLEADRQRASLVRDCQASGQQAASAQAELASTRATLEQMRNSRTWRLGAPLRALAARLRRPAQPPPGDQDLELIRQSSIFDARWYLEAYPDVAASGIEAAEHFLRFGGTESRNPGPGFDTAAYLERNPDVAGCGMNPLVHFLRHGQAEGRRQQ